MSQPLCPQRKSPQHPFDSCVLCENGDLLQMYGMSHLIYVCVILCFLGVWLFLPDKGSSGEASINHPQGCHEVCCHIHEGSKTRDATLLVGIYDSRNSEVRNLQLVHVIPSDGWKCMVSLSCPMLVGPLGVHGFILMHTVFIRTINS
jgi:hypothetical protein